MWWLATAGLGVMQAFQQRDQAEADASNQRMQIEWGNHQQKLQFAAQNRKIAQANAQQWMMNQEITKAAYQAEAESKVYLRHRVDNEIGAYSRGSSQQNAQITQALEGKNIKGGSARAIFKSKQLTENEIMKDKAVSYSNAARDIQREREEMVAQRNFGYNDYVKYVSTDSSHIDPKAAGKKALMGGLLQTAMSTMGQMGKEYAQEKQYAMGEAKLESINPDYKTTEAWKAWEAKSGGKGFMSFLGNDVSSAFNFDWLGELFS